MINQDSLILQQIAIETVLNKLASKDEIVFKAPTGSGKTVMIAEIMDKWIEKHPDNIFIVTTLAKSELGIQNHKTFISFTDKLKHIKPYIIDPADATTDSGIVIPNEYNVYSLTDALFKKTSKISRGPLYQFLTYLKNQGKKIIWVKDECHKAFNNFDELYSSGKYPFIKKINISATPSPTKFPIIDCKISEEDAERACLIKKLVGKKNFNRCQGFGNSFEVDKYAELKDALAKFTDLRTKYMNAFGIRPCLIIQIPDSKKGEEELGHLIPFLSKKDKDGNYFFNWIYICDDVKQYQTNTNLGNEDKLKRTTWRETWKEQAKKNNSNIDIIIFKMVITEGWDIKRANMLFQIRDTKSETLTEQVVGRIRRNPILLSWDKHTEAEHKLALEAYVWGDLKDVDREFKSVERTDPNNLLKIQTTILKNLKQIYSEEGINLQEFLNDWRFPDDKKSIFQLYSDWDKLDDETKLLLKNNINTNDDWFKFSYNIDKIVTENKRLYKNYNKSIKLGPVTTLPDTSYFEVFKNSNVGPAVIKTEEDSFGWKIISEQKDEKYYFDSEAEFNFVEELKYFSKKIWARNFYPNSKIGFEYINISKHTTFPDFILKDKKDRFHIFEVKSFNESKTISINRDDYKQKVISLKDFFLHLSKKLQNYLFYIPIKYEDVWDIYRYANGKEDCITLDQLKQSLE